MTSVFRFETKNGFMGFPVLELQMNNGWIRWYPHPSGYVSLFWHFQVHSSITRGKFRLSWWTLSAGSRAITYSCIPIWVCLRHALCVSVGVRNDSVWTGPVSSVSYYDKWHIKSPHSYISLHICISIYSIGIASEINSTELLQVIQRSLYLCKRAAEEQRGRAHRSIQTHIFLLLHFLLYLHQNQHIESKTLHSTYSVR